MEWEEKLKLAEALNTGNNKEACQIILNNEMDMQAWDMFITGIDLRQYTDFRCLYNKIVSVKDDYTRQASFVNEFNFDRLVDLLECMEYRKYRGKDISTNKWIYGDHIENQGRDYIYQASTENTLSDDEDTIMVVARRIKDGTLGQSIGVKDRNGMDACSGDIVKAYSAWFTRGYEICEILFLEGEYYFDCEGFRYRIYQHSDFEILGNIHDNPELLED